MPYDPKKHTGRLKRLSDSYYLGRACVHWTLNTKDRRTGWLNTDRHGWVRESLLHACVRYRLCCPAYCLMPDHMHFLILGSDSESNQRKAIAMFKSTWSEAIPTHPLQRQAFDHVIRGSERERDALLKVVYYILNNPVRKEWVGEFGEWSYSGSLVPGYPGMNPRKFHFWQNFWNAYADLAGAQW